MKELGRIFFVTLLLICSVAVFTACTDGEHIHTPAAAVRENEIPATCSAEGSYENVVYCSDCEEEISREKKSIEKISHTAVTDEAKAPTCTNTGLTEGQHCSVCNEVIAAQEEISALGHSYDNRICTRCDEKAYSTGISFVSNGDGTCYVANIGTCEDSYIIIPPTSPSGDKVTSIGSSAFYGCTSLTSIEIPDSVTSIGYSAFYGCESLKYNEYDNAQYLGNSDNPYILLVKVKDISINSCNIHQDTKSIGDNAFFGCTSLTSIEIPDGVTSIGYAVFYGCTSLTSIEIPNSVTSIGIYAFSGCASLTSIEIPDGVTSIGHSAFYGCTSLTNIEIPNSVTSIGYAVFYDCTSLTSIQMTDGVTSIGSSAFCGCTSLTSIEIPDGVTSIGNYAFSGCTSLTSIEIPDNVTSIGYYAFYGCASLTSIEIPDGVTSIGYAVFYGCTSLESIEIPDGVTSIGSSAFSGCTSLTNIVIPDGVTSIGYAAFYGCTKLDSIEFKNTSGWFVSTSSSATSGENVDVSDASQNATYFKSTYCSYYWERNE